MTIQYLDDKEQWALRTPMFKLDHIDNLALAKEILENGKRKSEETASTFYEDFVVTGECPEAQKVVDAVREIGERSFGKADIEWWTQIHYKGESSNTHHHFPAQVSWAYWVKQPVGAGKFVFIINDFASIMTEVEPFEGGLMFFPGWVSHKVTRNTSDDCRISMAGNFKD